MKACRTFLLYIMCSRIHPNEVNLAPLLNSLTASISAFIEHRARGTGELDSLEGYFLGHQEVPEEGGKVWRRESLRRILEVWHH